MIASSTAVPEAYLEAVRGITRALPDRADALSPECVISAFLQGLGPIVELPLAVLQCKDKKVVRVHARDAQAQTLMAKAEVWWFPPEANGHPQAVPAAAGPQDFQWFASHPVAALSDEGYFLVLFGTDEEALRGLSPFAMAVGKLLDSLLSPLVRAPNGTPATPSERTAWAPIAPVAASEVKLLQALLTSTISLGASDLHLKAGAYPVVRAHGELKALPEVPKLTPELLSAMFHGITSQRQQVAFRETRELDFAYSLGEAARLRVNVAQQRGSLSFAFRVIPNTTPAWETLGIPEVCKDLIRRRSGLILVTGPTGSGKSTTLAALLDLINKTQSVRIVTIEDPIEFTHQDQKAHIIQREVGEDTTSFAEGLRRALRQDPDVILIGEMRDLETISTALTAAETGHLVLGTLHTQSAAQTVERITDVFPAGQQPQVRLQLSSVLAATISQRLLKRLDKPGRVAAFEIMLGITAIRNLIREGKLHEIPSYIAMNTKSGMRTLEQSLAELLRKGLVSLEEARETANDQAQLETPVKSAPSAIKPRAPQ